MPHDRPEVSAAGVADLDANATPSDVASDDDTCREQLPYQLGMILHEDATDQSVDEAWLRR